MRELLVCFACGCLPPAAGFAAFVAPWFAVGFVREYRRERISLERRVAEHALLMSIWREQR